MSKNALVLAGGGARAAYQVGVLKALVTMHDHDGPLPFEILSGVSAGALNTTKLASMASQPKLAISQLENIWRNLEPENIFTMSQWPIASSIGRTLINAFMKQQQGMSLSLMDNTPLRELLLNNIEFQQIRQQIDAGNLEALTVSATNYTSGASQTFIQGKPSTIEWDEPRAMGVVSPINVNHLMASSALPGLFPPQSIGNEYFGDGAIRQGSCLRPAIKLGADKILVVGLGNQSHKKTEEAQITRPPTIVQVVGHLFNGAFLDPLNDDIRRLTLINDLIKPIIESGQTCRYRPIEAVVITPSIGLGELAIEYLDTLPSNLLKLLKIATGDDRSRGATAASYLLFTKEYCGALIDMGYQDTMWKATELATFFKEYNAA